MPRDWHPLRFFVRDNGRPYPTILLWLFLIPALTIVLAGCFTVLNRRAEQETVEAALTKTPTLMATVAADPTGTATPNPPTAVPAATEFVYDDPSGWEFIEKTDPSGKKYMDLLDWQKEQVWHAFEVFWNLRYRAEGGMTLFEVIEPLVSGRYLEGVLFDYEFATDHGEYVYLLQSLDATNRAMILDSDEAGEVRVKVVLISDSGFPLERRDVQTGGVLETDRKFPYKTWEFMLTYLEGRWIVEDSTAEELE